MTAILLAALLSFVNPVASNERQLLRRYRPQLINMKQESGIAMYERTIPLATAKTFVKYLAEKNPGYDLNTVIISKIPATTDLYFVALQRYRDPEQGNVFLVLRKQGAEITEVSRAENDIICGMLDPAFFVGRDRVLIILSISAFDGGYCGNFPFEFKGNNLTALGDIPVYDGVHGPGGYQGHSPIETALAEFKENTYFVTMRGRGSLYGDNDKRLARPKIPITYYFDSKTPQSASEARWKRVNPAR